MKLDVQITANAPRSEIVGWLGGRLKIKIKAPAVEGKANAELVRFLAGRLGLHVSRLVILRGETARMKTMEIEGMDEVEMRDRLGADGV